MDFENSNYYRAVFTTKVSWRSVFADLAIVASFAMLLAVGLIQGQTNHIAVVAGPLPVSTTAAAKNTSIRPFHIQIPEEQLVDLRHRLAATRWPDQETVPDRSQGAQLAAMKELVHYWQTDYDWRKVEARLNALPQFVTTIDGLDIHFIHVRSKHSNALPVIVTHGWPGSIIEQMKIIDPLTNPTASGGMAEDAFDVVIPSLPGYGFSGKPTNPGWNPVSIARSEERRVGKECRSRWS